jgi:hypothetical protein
MAGTGRSAASSGSQIRAASRQPSGNVIQTGSQSSIVRGRACTSFMATSGLRATMK